MEHVSIFYTYTTYLYQFIMADGACMHGYMQVHNAKYYALSELV